MAKESIRGLGALPACFYGLLPFFKNIHRTVANMMKHNILIGAININFQKERIACLRRRTHNPNTSQHFSVTKRLFLASFADELNSKRSRAPFSPSRVYSSAVPQHGRWRTWRYQGSSVQIRTRNGEAMLFVLLLDAGSHHRFFTIQVEQYTSPFEVKKVETLVANFGHKARHQTVDKLPDMIPAFLVLGLTIW